jgi:hypothetical protein
MRILRMRRLSIRRRHIPQVNIATESPLAIGHLIRNFRFAFRLPTQGLPVNPVEQGWHRRPHQGGKKEGRAYYGHSQGAYGGWEVAKESLTP